MDKGHECGKPKRGNVGWGKAFLTNTRIDPLSLDRYPQGEGRIDTHAICLPPQESWAAYYDTAGETLQRLPVTSMALRDSSTEAYYDTARETLQRLPVTSMAQRDSSTEALDTDEGRRVTERIVVRASQIQEKEQEQTES